MKDFAKYENCINFGVKLGFYRVNKFYLINNN